MQQGTWRWRCIAKKNVKHEHQTEKYCNKTLCKTQSTNTKVQSTSKEWKMFQHSENTRMKNISIERKHQSKKYFNKAKTLEREMFQQNTKCKE